VAVKTFSEIWSVEFLSKYEEVGYLHYNPDDISLSRLVSNNYSRILQLMEILKIKDEKIDKKENKLISVHQNLFNNTYVGLSVKGANLKDAHLEYPYLTLVAIQMLRRENKKYSAEVADVGSQEGASTTDNNKKTKKTLLEEVFVSTNVQIAHYGYAKNASSELKNDLFEFVCRWRFDYTMRNAFKHLDDVIKVQKKREETEGENA
jgi:hypothetical protein